MKNRTQQPTSTKRATLPNNLPPTAKSRNGKRPNWRKSLFRLHGWLGLNVGLLLFVICFSGSVATLSYEIDWLLNPDIRTAAKNEPYDWTAMHQSVRSAFPDGENLGVYVPRASGFAAVSYVRAATGQLRKVYLDPYSGRLQGHTSFFNTQRFFRSFHRRFFDGERGIVIVTLCAFVLLLAAITGFTYYKGWLKQLVTLRRDKGPRIFWSDLHKGAGIWGIAFTLLIAFTGIFYFVEVCVQGAGNYEALLPEPLPEVSEASLNEYGPQPKLLPAGAYVDAAREAFPDLTVRSVRLPHAPNEAVYVDGQAGNPLTRDRANKVHLHPFTGKVLGVQRSSQLGPVPFITDAVDPLHFGYFGGLWTKVLWCLFGLMLSFSILSGTYLWIVRSRPMRHSRPSGRPSAWLRGAPVAFALTTAYFLVAAWATISGIQGYSIEPTRTTPVDAAAAGPYQVQIRCVLPCDAQGKSSFTLRFEGQGLPNYQKASLIADTAEAALEGRARAPRATITARRSDSLQLRVEMRSGVTHETTFFVPENMPSRPSTLKTTSWPETAPGVWWVVGIFSVVTISIMTGWLYCLWTFQVTQQQRFLGG